MPDNPQTPLAPEPGASPKRRRVLIFGGILLVNLALLILLLTQLLTPASQATTDPLLGHAAPAFTLPLVSTRSATNMISLASLRGKPLVINFWASWCDPCKEEAALLEQSWEQLHTQGKDVAFVGIDFQESHANALGFLQTYHITYPLVLDSSGTVANAYTIHSLPDTIFVKRDGTVASKVAQQITGPVLSQNLKLIVG